jgi:hypothetical protein
MNKKIIVFGWILLTAVAMANPFSSWSMQVTETLRIDGFGMQGYYITSKNNYLGPNDTQGTFNFNALNLVIKADIDSHFRVWAKLFADYGIKDAVEVTWAFGEYHINDRLQVRIGKVKMPLGIYSEIGGIYPILPTTILPMIYLDSANMSPDELKGISLTGRLNQKNLKISYDLFGGRSGGDIDTADHLQVENLIGSRVWYLSQDDRLKIGLSYFHGLMVSPQALANIGMSHYQASLELQNLDQFSLRAEWALHQEENSNSSLSYYVETTYLINESWMPLLRYDLYFPVRGKETLKADYQKEVVAGLHHRISDYMTWKGEIHFIRGVALLDTDLPNSSPEENWNLFITSLTFLF